MRNVVQFKDKNDVLYNVKDVVARATKADAANLYNYKNASGSIVTVDDAEAESAKKLRIKINPVQDLHGYDNPWPAGGGKNLLPPLSAETKNGVTITVADDGTITINGTATEDTYFDKYFDASCKQGDAVHICGFNPSAGDSRLTIFIIGSAGNDQVNLSSTNAVISTTASADNTISRWRLRVPNGLTLTNFVAKPMLQIGGTAPTSYSPYSNVCHISGWDSANVSRAGKNLLPNKKAQNSPTKVLLGTDTDAIIYYYYLKPGTYKLSYNMLNGATALPYYKIGENGSVVQSDSIVIPSGNNDKIRIWLYNSNGIPVDNVGTFQLELGSTATAYEPYSGSTTEYPFPQEAGTVYGAELTINQDGTGTFVSDRGYKRHTGQTSENWTYSSWSGTDTAVFYSSVSLPNARADFGNYNCIVSCNMFPVVGYNALRDNNAIGVTITGGGPVYVTIRIPKSIASTVEELKSYLENNPLDIVYELSEPIVYQLTAQQVLTLLQGTNNIWADTGDIEIDYPVAKMISKDEADERYAGMIYVDGESAPIVSIEDGAENVPLKKLEVEINPVQDLHGYDYPWPAGGGKNKFKNTATTATLNGVTFTVNSDGSVSCSGTATGTFSFTLGSYTVGASDEILNGCPSGGGGSSYLLRFVAGTTYSDTGSGATIPANASGKVVIYIVTGQNMNGKNFYPMIRLSSVSDDTFEPYENICPISGWNSANVSRTGINIWDEEWELGSISSAGQLVDATDRIRCKNAIRVIPGESIYVVAPSAFNRACWYDINQNLISSFSYVGRSYTVPNNAYFMRFTCTSAYGTTYNHDISFNYPSTDTQYHPGHVQKIEYEFPQEAGTVYGAKLTIYQDGSGELVVDRASVEYDGSPDETWGEYVIGETYYCCVSYPTGKALGNQKSICNRFKNQNAAYGSGEYGIYCDHPTLVNTYFRMPNAEITTKQGFLAWIAQNPIQLVYDLATPVTYHLTNQQVIELLKGTNNIWADTGNVAITYPADTKITIDGIRSDIVQLQNALIAPVLPGMVADTALAANDFRIVNGTLYRVMASIASGGTLTVGTNVVATTIGEQLKAILNAN